MPPTRKAVVIACSVGVGTLLYTLASLIGRHYGLAFFAIPIFIGLAAGALGPERPYRSAWYALVIALGLSIVAFREGVVCVLLSVPVLLPGVLLGAWAGSVLHRHIKTRRAQGGWLGLIVLLGAGAQLWDTATDDARQHPIHVATSERAIAAPPERVFEVLTARELRVPQRWPWFIRIGLPMPEAMIMEQPGLGGRIRFEFAHMTAYARITTWQPPHQLHYEIERYVLRDLPFHITRLGRGPDYGLKQEHVSDWLTVLDTQYSVRAAPDGSSYLRRRIVWQRHLAPDLYFGWLQQAIIERGQARLLELIDERVQGAGAREALPWSAGLRHPLQQAD